MSEARDTPFETDHLKADLSGRSVRGGAITLGSQSAKFLLQMVSTVVLARLLIPEDFGLIAMMMVVVGFAAVFKDLGFSWATVQSKTITHAQVSALFWLQTAASVFLAALLALASPLAASIYDEPRLVGIGLALSSTFVFHGVAAQHLAILRRQMRYGAISTVELTSQLLAVVIAILVAWRGGGYWALVALQVVAAATSSLLLWMLSSWRPSLPRLRVGIAPMVAFGSQITAGSFLNYFTKQADHALLGYFAGAAQLGLYTKAYNLFQMPIRQINGPLNAVAMPALSRLQDDADAYRRFYLRLVEGLAYVTIPLVALAAGVAGVAIPFVLGEQWTEAARIFQLLALAGVVTPILWTAGWVHHSRGRADRALKWSLVSDPVYVVSYVVGVRWGAVGVATAFAVTILALFLPTMLFAFRGTGIRLRDLMSCIVPPGVLGVTVFTVAALALRLPAQHELIALLWALLSAGVCVIFIVMAWRKPRRDIRRLAALRSHLRRSA